MKTSTSKAALWMAGVLCSAGACSNADDGGADYEAQATVDVKKFVGAELQKLSSAVEAIQKAAPAADDDGWNAEADAAAVADMRKAWKQAREAYEHIEGSIAVLFDKLDVSTDQRYDYFIEIKPDDNLFDDKGVTGMHGIERILWSDSTPERVVKFEAALPGYKAAAFPKTKDEAEAFKNQLCALLVKDTTKMREDFAELALKSTAAFNGMISSVREQSEKTDKAATGEDESRYAQNTMADMRANLDGARKVFNAFKPWIDDTTGNSARMLKELDELGAAYAEVKGDALPEVPKGFNPDEPSEDALATPYGKLWKLLVEKTDEQNPDSLVSVLGKTAEDMGIPGITAE